MTVRTRFAPSPTGFLHIGSARTALFNWLFARHHGGKFLLRVEDTDQARSTPEAVEAIFNSLKWLGLEADEEPVFQFSRAARHREVAHELLKAGKAYQCFCTPEELEQMREEARAKGLSPRYDGRWRDRNPALAPHGVRPVIRFKAPQSGATTIKDQVQGEVTLQNTQLDDMILLRADETPTYMLSVVVDDHDMNITHIIRGDDHLTNAFRQLHLFQACGWTAPEFAHIPLIHGSDGTKLSKRHGALGAEFYQQQGFLADAMANYLLRLGWGHGDDEIIKRSQAIEWFNLQAIVRSPARFDLAKLTNLNAFYLRESTDLSLIEQLPPFLENELQRPLTLIEVQRIQKGLPGLKQRARTLIELAQNALFYIEIPDNEEMKIQLSSPVVKTLLNQVYETLHSFNDFSEIGLDQHLRLLADNLNIKLGNLAQPLRIALTGSTVSPSIFEVMTVLGKEETLKRLKGEQ